MGQLIRKIVITSLCLILTSCVVIIKNEDNKSSDDSINGPLHFIDSVEIPRGAVQDGYQIGGLSSLYFDSVTNQLATISDDTSVTGTPRMHIFDIGLSTSGLHISPNKAIALTNELGESFQPDETIDAEAFDRLSNGNWVLSSEGIMLKDRFTKPQLLEFSPIGELVKRWPFPETYLPDLSESPSTGIRSNAGFEGLHMSPNKQNLFLATELALLQDGEVSTYDASSLTRIIHMKPDGEFFQVREEYLYPLSKMPNFGAEDDVFKLIGISDIMAVSNNRLLVLERSYTAGVVNRNTVQIFIVDLDRNTIHRSEEGSGQQKVLVKRLWVDMDSFLNVPEFPRIDNIEGMILGPVLENGNQSLILISDNNFSARQKTLFYAFEILTNL